MNLRSKKELAARTLKVGKERITLIDSRKDEIKEAITKQDIKDLVSSGAIVVKEIKGRKKVETRKRARGVGKVKKKINQRKRNYVNMTRKLRKYSKAIHDRGEIGKDDLKEIRKKVRNKEFKSKAHLKTHIGRLNE